MRRWRSAPVVALVGVGILLAAAAPASAAPKWKIASYSASTAQPGEILDYRVEIQNIGDQVGTSEPIVLTATLPQGLKVATPASVASGPHEDKHNFNIVGFRLVDGTPPSLGPTPCTRADGISSLTGGEIQVRCEDVEPVWHLNTQMLFLPVTVGAGLSPGALRTAQFAVEGGGAPSAATVDPVRIVSGPPGFGLDGFDNRVAGTDGLASTAAAAHPDSFVTDIDFNTAFDRRALADGPYQPVGRVKDVSVTLPPGLVGNPSALDTCSLPMLARVVGTTSKPACDPTSQVGTIYLRLNFFYAGLGTLPAALYNLESPPGTAARFGFAVNGVVTVIDAHLRPDPAYVISGDTTNAAEALPVAGSHIELWGEPGAAEHDLERSCADDIPTAGGGASCPGNPAAGPFLRSPTSCTSSQPFSIAVDSWEQPGLFDNRSMTTHQAPGYPADPSEWGPEVGTEDCAAVPFSPAFLAAPTTEEADSPTGLQVEFSMPQQGLTEAGAISESDLRDAVVQLPAGMSVNPSSATGLGACSTAQIGLTTPPGQAPARFDASPAACPDSAKVGTAEVETPLLDHPIEGTVYLAAQGDNPFSSLLALYIAIEDPASGVIVKLPGRIETDPNTGRLRTVFADNPQLPFSHLAVDLFGGTRAPLRTPPSCGAYQATAELTPWSGNAPAQLSSGFAITSGPHGSPCPSGGFDPHLSAGTQNPLAGSYSPFSLRLSREDGTQELAGLRLAVPKGLVASLKGIPYCSDAALAAISTEPGTGNAQLSAPSCPAASQVGTVTAGAGAGVNPFYSTTGKAYLAGPYKGAPLSLAVVTPAVAGPFDLGNVVVRNALRIDPESTQVSVVSDPLPTILHGIPLDLRDVRVNLDRSEFTRNPTSCEPLSFEADIAGAGGAQAHRSQHFQAAGCDRLPFKPKFAFSLKGKPNRGAHPALRAVVVAGFSNEANISFSSVALPHSEFLDQSHIGTICTRVQYAAGNGGGEQCPPKSIYGFARAFTPLLDKPVEGPVYLRSSSHELPDLVVSLHGQIQADLVGRVDSTKGGGIRTTFESVPDVFVSKFVLSMQGGKKGLLQNSTNICNGAHRATVKAEAHNGTRLEVAPELKADCGPKARKGKGGSRNGR